MIGEAAVAYQTFCQSLAQQGYVVLIYDPISQEERRQYVAVRHPMVPTDLCNEHNIENKLPQDSEQIPPGFLAAGLEMADFFIARAPRPTLSPGQRNGFFDPRGVGESMPVTSHMQNFI